MTNVSLLCAATALVVAAWELPACSASTGANNLIGYSSSGGAAIDTAQGGAVAMGGGGAGAFISQPGSGSSAPPGTITGVSTRPMDMGNGPDGSCGELPFTAEQATKTTTITHVTPEPIDLYLMWDQSLSMSCAISSGTGGAGGMGGVGGATAADRWDAVKEPLSAWVQSVPADPPFNVGIGYFGIPMMFGQDPSAQCDAANYEKPDVEIGPLPQNATAIVNSLNAHEPSTNTPTKAALEGAVNHALSWKMSHPNEVVAVVLVTDGEPNSCGSVQDVADTAAMAYDNGMGVQTFVIGVTSSGTTCFIDPDPPSVSDLDTVAMAGGTGKALVVDVAQNPQQQLTDELDMIRKSITMTTTKTDVMTSKLPCQFQIPMDVNMTNGPHVVFDKDKVNVDFTSNQGVKQSVYRVDSLDKCGTTSALGWYYDDDDMPTQVLLCPNACSQIQAPTADGGVDPTIAGMAPKVSIVLGCKSIYAPPA